LVGAFFKEKSPSVKHLDAIVSKANINELGEVVSLTLDGGGEVFGDFFIDASGFARLLSKTLGIKWISYKDYLPVDTAMPFLTPFKNNEKISPVTTAWAQKNGWMWKIPTQERYGCGYVFSSQYTDVDSAKKEIELSLGHEISPIKIINFEAGRLETMWSKNCLFIGLSSAFLEPLEATSIHSTITQLFSFIFSYLRDTKEETCNQGTINTYNTISASMYDGFRDFLSIHYASNRLDSEFWRDISKEGRRTEKAKNILDIATYRVLNDGDFFKSTGFEGSVLHNWVLAGLGKITKETAIKELDFYRQTEYGQEFHAKFLQNMASFKSSTIENTHLINILRS
jgi:tryptophan halogenase